MEGECDAPENECAMGVATSETFNSSGESIHRIVNQDSTSEESHLGSHVVVVHKESIEGSQSELDRKVLPETFSSSSSTLDATVEFSGSGRGGFGGRGGGITSDRYRKNNNASSVGRNSEGIEFSPDQLQLSAIASSSTPHINWAKGTVHVSCEEEEAAAEAKGDRKASVSEGADTVQHPKHVAKRLELTSMLLEAPNQQHKQQHRPRTQPQKQNQQKQHQQQLHTPKRNEDYKNCERLLTLTPESPLSDLSSPSPGPSGGIPSNRRYGGERRIQLEGKELEEDEGNEPGREDSLESHSKRFSGTNDEGTEGEESDQNFCSLSATCVYRSMSGEVSMQHIPDMESKRDASSTFEAQRSPFPSLPPPSKTTASHSSSAREELDSLERMEKSSAADELRANPESTSPLVDGDCTGMKSAPRKTNVLLSSLQTRMMRSSAGFSSGSSGASTLPPALTEEKLRSQFEATALKKERTSTNSVEGTKDTIALAAAAAAAAETAGIAAANADLYSTSSKAMLSCILSPLSFSSLQSPPDGHLESNARTQQTVPGIPRMHSDSAQSSSTVGAETLAAIGEGILASSGGGARGGFATGAGVDAYQQSISSLSCSSIHPSTHSPSELGALESPMTWSSMMLNPSPMASASSTSMGPFRKQRADAAPFPVASGAPDGPTIAGSMRGKKPPQLRPDESYGRARQPSHPFVAEGMDEMESPSLYRTPPRTRGDAEDESAMGNSPGLKVGSSNSNYNNNNRSPASVLSWNTNRRSHSPPNTPQKLDHRRPASRQLTPRVPLHPTLPTSKLALSSSVLSQLTPTHKSHQKQHHQHLHHHLRVSSSQHDSSMQSVSCSSHANSSAVSPSAAGHSRELTPASAFLQRFQTPPYSLLCPSEDTTAATLSVSPQDSSAVSRSHSTSGKTDDFLSRITPEKKDRIPFSTEHQTAEASSNKQTSKKNHSRGNISQLDATSIEPKVGTSGSGNARTVEKVSRRLSLSIAAAGIPGQRNDASGSMDTNLLSFQHYQEPPRLSLLTTYSNRSNASSARRVGGGGGRDLSIGSVRSSVLDASNPAAAAHRHGPSPLLPSYTFLESQASSQVAPHPLAGGNSSSSVFLARPSYTHHIRHDDEVDFLLPNRNPFSLYRGWAGLLFASRVNCWAKKKELNSSSQDKEEKDSGAADEILAASTESRGSNAATQSTANTVTSPFLLAGARGGGEFSIQPHAAAVVFHHTYPTTESDFVDAIEVAQLSVRANASSAKEKPHGEEREQQRKKKTKKSNLPGLEAASPTDEEGINDVSDISRRTTPASPILETGAHAYSRRPTAAFPKSPDNNGDNGEDADTGRKEGLDSITSPSAFRKAAMQKVSKPMYQRNIDGNTTIGMPSVIGTELASDPTSSDIACVNKRDDTGSIPEQHTLDEHNRTWPQLSSRQRLTPTRPTLLHPSLKAIPSSTSTGNSGFSYSSPKRQLVSISVMDSQEDKEQDGRYNNNDATSAAAMTTTATTTTTTTMATEGDSWCERARRGASLAGPESGGTRKSTVGEIGKDASDPPTGWATATPSPTSMNLNAELQHSTPFTFRSPGAETKSYTSEHCVSPFSPDSVTDRLRSPIELRNILFTAPPFLQQQGCEPTSAPLPLPLSFAPHGSVATPDRMGEGREAAMENGDARQTDFASGSLTSAYVLANYSPGRGTRGAGNLVSPSSAMSSFSRPRSADLADIFSDRDISPTNRPATTVWVDSDRLFFGNATTPVGQHSAEFPQSSSSRRFFGSSLRSQVTAPGSPQMDYDVMSSVDERSAALQNRSQPSTSSRHHTNTPERTLSSAEDAARIIHKAMLHLSPKRSLTSTDPTWESASPNSKLSASSAHVDGGNASGVGDGSPDERAGEGEAEGSTRREQPADRDSVFTPIKFQNSSKQKTSTAVQDTPKKVETPAPAYRGVELQRIRSVNHHWDNSNFDTLSVSSTATSATTGRRAMRMTSALAQLRTSTESQSASSARPAAAMVKSATRAGAPPMQESREKLASSMTAVPVARPTARGGSSRDEVFEEEEKAKKSSEVLNESVSSPMERQRREEPGKEEIHHLSSPPLMKWGVPPRMNASLSRADQSSMSHFTGLHDDPNASSGRWYDGTHIEHNTSAMELPDHAGFTSDRRTFMDDTVDYDDEDDEDINPLNRFRHHHRYQFLHRLPWRVLSKQQPQNSDPKRSACTSSKEENGTASPGEGASRSGSGTSDRRSSIGVERLKRGSSDAECTSHATDGGSSMHSFLDSPSMPHMRIDLGAAETKQGSETCRNVHLGKSAAGTHPKPTEKAETPSIGFIPLSVDRNGIVWLVTSRADGMPYAVKEVDFTETLQTNTSYAANSLLRDELACYLIATSPDASPYARNNLARYYTVTRHEMSDVYMIQSEYFAHGSVMEWVLKRSDPRVALPLATSQSSSLSSNPSSQDVAPQQWLLMIQHGLLALRELHQCNLVHGNPLPFNLFVATPHQFKLGNFGSAVQFPTTYPNVTPSAFLPLHATNAPMPESTVAPVTSSSAESGSNDSHSVKWTPYQIDLHVFVSGMLYMLHRYLSSSGSSLKSTKSTVDMQAVSLSFGSTTAGSSKSASTCSTCCCSERCFYDKQHVLGASASTPSAATPTRQFTSPLSWSYAAVFDVLHAGTEVGCTIASLLQRIDTLNKEALGHAASANIETKVEAPSGAAGTTPKSEALLTHEISAFSLKSHSEEELRLSVDLEISTLLQQNALMRQRLESMRRASQSKRQNQSKVGEDAPSERVVGETGRGEQQRDNDGCSNTDTQTKTAAALSSQLPSTILSASLPKLNAQTIKKTSATRDVAPDEEKNERIIHNERDALVPETTHLGDEGRLSSSDSINARPRSAAADRVRPEGTPPLVPDSYRVGSTPLITKQWHQGYGTPYSPSDTVHESTSQLQGFDSPVGSQRSSSIPFSPLPTDMLPCSTATLLAKSCPPPQPSSTRTPLAMPSRASSRKRSSEGTRPVEKEPQILETGAPDAERSPQQEFNTPDRHLSSDQQQQLQRTPKFSFIPVTHSSPLISPAQRSSSSAVQPSLPATPKLTHVQRPISRNSFAPPTTTTSTGGAKGEGTPLSSASGAAATHAGFSTPLRSTGPRNQSLRNSPGTPRLSLFSEVRPKIDQHPPIGAGRERSFSTPHASASDALRSERRMEGASKAQSHSSVSPVLEGKEPPHAGTSARKTVHGSHGRGGGVGPAPQNSPRDVNRCLIADDYSDDNCSNSGNSQERVPSQKPFCARPIGVRRKTDSGSDDTSVSRLNSVLMGSLDAGRAAGAFQPVELGRHSSCPVGFGGGRNIEELQPKERKVHRPVLSLGSELAWNTDLHSAASAGMQSYAIPTPKSVDAVIAHNTSYFHTSMLSGMRSESIFTQTAERSMSRQYLQSLKTLSYKQREEKVSRNRLMEVLAERNLTDPNDAMLWIIREINRMMQLENLHLPARAGMSDSTVHVPSSEGRESAGKADAHKGQTDESEEVKSSSTTLFKDGDNEIKSASLVKERKHQHSAFYVPVSSSTYPLTSKEL